MRISTLLISALLCLPLTSAYANNYSNKVYAKKYRNAKWARTDIKSVFL